MALKGLLQLSAIAIVFVVDVAAAAPPSYRVEVFDYPGSMETFAFGINDAGYIVGTYRDGPFFPEHAFLRTPDGTFSDIHVPGAFSSSPRDINAAGEVVGLYYVLSKTDPDPTAFIRQPDGTYQSFLYPGSPSSFALGLNDAGWIVGGYDAGQFLRSPTGQFSALSDCANDINNRNELVCGLANDKGDTFGPIPGGSGLRRADGSVVVFDAPSLFSGPAGINDSGQLVGAVLTDDHWHAFLATPAIIPEPLTYATIAFGFALLGLYSFARERRKSTTLLR